MSASRIVLVLAAGGCTHVDRVPTTPVRLSIDLAARPEVITQNVQDAFRLAFWVKDHRVGELEGDPERHPLALGVARAAELLLFDIPIASEVTVIPHEVAGHGGRIREFGGRATYSFELPPPYSFSPSATHVVAGSLSSTVDMNLLIDQAGIAVEAHEARYALHTAFESGRLDHLDSGLMFGIPIHEIIEATVPFAQSDVRHWTTLQADHFGGVSAESIQHRYLALVAITSLVNPTFLYSAYDLLWRFLVEGKRTGALPTIRVGPAELWASTHVSPTPWGLELELDVLTKWPDCIVGIAPHAGTGPGGSSGGIALAISNVHVSPIVVIAAGLDAWLQPDLAVAAPILFGTGPRAPTHLGASTFAEVRWDHPGWFVGLRASTKTKVLVDLQPIAASGDVIAFTGLLLGRP
ncbi:MAG: hypothetical protein ABI467_03460 [Kofleriaceae bacterium]